MSNDLMLIFMIAISLFVMQAVGGVFQIRNYKTAIRRVHKKGNVGIGQKRGKLFNGNIVIIACDCEQIITDCEIMDGKTFLAKFHQVDYLLGKNLKGVSIDELLKQLRSMEARKQKQYRGYIQALEALELRFHNADCTEEMNTAEHLELRKSGLT